MIALQLLVVNRAWELSAEWGVGVYIGVLFALGSTMILGSLLLWLDPKYLSLPTIMLVAAVALLIPSAEQWSKQVNMNTISYLLLVPGGDIGLWVNYPVLPWLPLMLFGMTFGYWLVDDTKKAFGRALKLGLVFLLFFIVLRVLDGFGNIRPRQGNTVIDFFNVVKYPPSITFMLLTMGANLAILGLIDRMGERSLQIIRPLLVFGRVPLFFYLLHLFFYAGMGRFYTPEGTSIAEMYLYWLLGLVNLFPMCFLYSRFKQRQPFNRVLRYLRDEMVGDSFGLDAKIDYRGA